MVKRLKKSFNYIPIIVVAVIVIALILFLRPGMKGEMERETSKSNILSDEVKTLADGTKYIIHPSEILSGGPPKDGIPSIDDPKFTSAEEADWLNPDDLVLGLNYNGVVKAYPHRILNWHEIVNDFADDKPVLVTYCPLCRTGIAFESVINGKRVEFGTSGKLWKANLVMYDRKTDTYWSQVGGKAIVGELAGMKLKQIPMDTAMWKDWKEKHPDTLVLSKDTGFFRSYDRDPYASFANSPGVGFGVDFKDTRLFSKAIVYGVLVGDKTKAYSEQKVKETKLLNDEFAGKKLLVFWDPELNAVKIFDRTVDREELEFSLDGKLVDNSGREWNFDGSSGEMQLERIDTFGLYWFSWLVTYPDTELFP